jgi:hypothetical protein
MPFDTGSNTIHTAFHDEDSYRDLTLKLHSDLATIMEKYSFYVSYIRGYLQEKGVRAEELCSHLMTISAFSCSDQKPKLLSAHRHELERADDINLIFNLLAEKYASFMSYGIFQSILKKYQKKCDIPMEQEELKYPELLKAFLENHKASDFVEINPPLVKVCNTSTKLILKLDIELTSSLAKIDDLKAAVARIIGLKSAALQLLDIKEGCVLVTFILPTPVANFLFHGSTVLTKEQIEQFQTRSILGLKCNGVQFDFTKSDPSTDTDLSIKRFVF